MSLWMLEINHDSQHETYSKRSRLENSKGQVQFNSSVNENAYQIDTVIDIIHLLTIYYGNCECTV